MPELDATNWPDDKICEIIELATPEIGEPAAPEINKPPSSSSKKSEESVYCPPSISIDDIAPMPKFESPLEDFLTKSAERDRTQAEADLLREISKDIRDKRNKRV